MDTHKCSYTKAIIATRINRNFVSSWHFQLLVTTPVRRLDQISRCSELPLYSEISAFSVIVCFVTLYHNSKINTLLKSSLVSCTAAIGSV